MLAVPLTTILVVVGLAGLASGRWLLRSFGRKSELWARTLGLVERTAVQRRCVVFYAASHGELLLLERLLPLLAAEQPDVEPVVIVSRLSVEKVARERLPLYRVHCLCPLVPWGMATALRRLGPDLFVVVEFARIPLWVLAARRLGIPRVIVNGRLSEKNRQRCQTWRWLLAPMLRAFDSVLVQSPDDVEPFLTAGVRPETIEVVGPLKFDAASYSRNTFAARRLARIAGIREDDQVLLAGSTREGEEAVVVSVFQRLAEQYPRLRLIVVPRNHHRFDEVAALLSQRGIAFLRRSQLDRPRSGEPPLTGTAQTSPSPPAAARVLLVDTVGELAAWWATAHVGFVGASLTSRGGQNMIEPAALGVATCFGPHTANFADVVSLLLAHDAAVEVPSEAALEAFIRRCLDDPAAAAELGRRAQAACLAQTGAMARTCARLGQQLEDSEGPRIVKMPERSSKQRRRAA